MFFILFCISIFIIHGFIIRSAIHYTPNIPKVDLTSIIEKETFTEEDYTLFYEQTGLTKPIIDELRTMPHFTEKILKYQEDYLTDITTSTQSWPPISFEDTIIDEEENRIPGFTLAPYHNGYIFLTKSTHTLNWRHGHAALVIDEIRGLTLEALNPGVSSMIQTAERWRYYPTFKMMRLKDVPQKELNKIASYAQRILLGLPYNILADKNQGDIPNTTHCSLLIWQAFNAFGYDLDSTGGLFVSPKNIATSPLLETLQIYGFDPSKDW